MYVENWTWIGQNQLVFVCLELIECNELLTKKGWVNSSKVSKVGALIKWWWVGGWVGGWLIDW